MSAPSDAAIEGGSARQQEDNRCVEVRALTAAEADLIRAWRYPGRYSTYDVDEPSEVSSDHWAVTEGGELFGYCCFGAPARVPGADAEDGTLDVGYGVAPDRMGRGHGHAFVAAILAFAWRRYMPRRFRLYVLDWNARSRRVAERHGFSVESVLESDEGTFLTMVRPAAS